MLNWEEHRTKSLKGRNLSYYSLLVITHNAPKHKCLLVLEVEARNYMRYKFKKTQKREKTTSNAYFMKSKLLSYIPRPT